MWHSRWTRQKLWWRSPRACCEPRSAKHRTSPLPPVNSGATRGAPCGREVVNGSSPVRPNSACALPPLSERLRPVGLGFRGLPQARMRPARRPLKLYAASWIWAFNKLASTDAGVGRCRSDARRDGGIQCSGSIGVMKMHTRPAANTTKASMGTTAEDCRPPLWRCVMSALYKADNLGPAWNPAWPAAEAGLHHGQDRVTFPECDD